MARFSNVVTVLCWRFQVAFYETEVEVYRTGEDGEGKWVKISCTSVVPGDVMKMKEGWKLPCDLILV